MFRKRRRPTPQFGIPPPLKPITGEYANLRADGIFPYVAMMQVAAEDTYLDYVICRGFDPRMRRFIDYEEDNADKPGISVAKPFGKRVEVIYSIGQVIPAVLPIQGTETYTPPSPTTVDWRVGQNPGVASIPGTAGNPQSLTDTIEELIDHNEKYVQWMLIDQGSPRRRFALMTALVANGSATAFIRHKNDAGALATDYTYEFTLYDTMGEFTGFAGTMTAGAANITISLDSFGGFDPDTLDYAYTAPGAFPGDGTVTIKDADGNTLAEGTGTINACAGADASITLSEQNDSGVSGTATVPCETATESGDLSWTDGTLGMCEYWADMDQWEVYQMACP